MSNKLIECRIIMDKQEVPYGQGLNWQARNEKQKVINDEFKKTVLRLLNKVVDFGGVLCVGKRDLQFDSRIYSEYLTIKIPRDKIEEIRDLNYVKSLET